MFVLAYTCITVYMMYFYSIFDHSSHVFYSLLFPSTYDFKFLELSFWLLFCVMKCVRYIHGPVGHCNQYEVDI